MASPRYGHRPLKDPKTGSRAITILASTWKRLLTDNARVITITLPVSSFDRRAGYAQITRIVRL